MSGFQQDAFQNDAFQVDNIGRSMEARWGVMRWGAFRWGAFTPRQCVAIGGTDWSSLIAEGSIQIHQALNDEPDTAEFTVIENAVFAPTVGQDVVIGSGSLTHREFGGQILRVREILTGGVERPLYQVHCQDWGKRFDRQTVTRLWTNTSATQIAADIVDGYTTGFTHNNITPDLPPVESFQATNHKPSELLRRLSALVGGAYHIDEYRDVHFFGEAGEPRAHTNPLAIDDIAPDTLRGFARERDSSQWRTRVIVEGLGTKVLAPVDAEETIIPVEAADIFNPSGGLARVAQELVAYTGRVDGGPGSLVGPGVAPPSYPIVGPAAGAGIETGVHGWAYAWVTASGETLPSPLYGDTMGPLAAPSTTPTRALASGTGLGVGTYQYAVTFVVGAGETTPGPAGSIVTDDGIDPPTTFPTANNLPFPIESHTGGRYNVGDSVYGRCSYVDASGNETGGTDSNTVVVQSNGAGGAVAVRFSSLPIPSDGNVVLKRLYLNVNGGFSAYYDIGISFTSWGAVAAGTATGGFPVGGTPERQRVSLTAIPIGPSGTTARKVYRTTAGGATLKLLTTIGDNATTTYVDSTADASLGADVPSSNTTQMNQASLTGIAIGPSGTTARTVYRTALNSAQLKLVTTIADNTTTTYVDSTADASLGANAPTGDTSALTQPTGQVNAGSTAMIVAGPSAFNAAGGWARVGEQVMRYAGISGSTLTGIPASGFGSLQATVTYGTTITEAPRLTGVSGLTHAITRGEDLYLRVQEDDLTAQAIIAQAEGDGGGIYAHTVVDHQLTEGGARARARSELAAFGRTLAEMEWETEDMNARPGRTQTVALVQVGSPAVAEIAETDRTILTADVMWPAPDTLPRRRCKAGTVKRADVIDIGETQRD